MIVKLIVVKGQDQGKVFYVRDNAKKTLGRSSRADIPLRDAGVSRLHCEIRNDGDAATLADLDSKNGTAANGVRLEAPHTLADGDRIAIGSMLIEARLAEALKDDDAAPVPPEETGAPASPGADAEQEAAPSAPDTAPAEAPQAASPETAPTQPEVAPPAGATEMDLEEATWEPSETQPHPEEPIFQFGEAQETPPEPAAEPRVGMTIGGCRIDEYTGRDELCRVYRGVQVSMERAVVLKILDPKATEDADAVQRFLKAAQAGGRLSHPNIVQVYDAGLEHGLDYIVLEHLEGESVQDLLRRRGRGKPLPLGQALDISDQILGALEHAHSQGVYHCSIRIDNIYLTRHGVAKLAELGFAESRLRQGAPPEEALGALYFAAPEQLGNSAAADARTDLYGLGMVAYVMLTGHLPFPSRKPQELMECIRLGRSEPIRNLNPAVPEPVRQAVEKAIAASASERFQSAGEMREALTIAR